MLALIDPDTGRRPAYELHLRARQLRSRAIAAGMRNVVRMFVAAFRRLALRVNQEMARRHHIRRLAALNDRLLADIGLQHCAIHAAVGDGRRRRIPDIQY